MNKRPATAQEAAIAAWKKLLRALAGMAIVLAACAGKLLCMTKSVAGIRPPIRPTSSSMRRNWATSWRCTRRLAHEPRPIANR